MTVLVAGECFTECCHRIRRSQIMANFRIGNKVFHNDISELGIGNTGREAETLCLFGVCKTGLKFNHSSDCSAEGSNFYTLGDSGDVAQTERFGVFPARAEQVVPCETLREGDGWPEYCHQKKSKTHSVTLSRLQDPQAPTFRQSLRNCKSRSALPWLNKEGARD